MYRCWHLFSSHVYEVNNLSKKIPTTENTGGSMYVRVQREWTKSNGGKQKAVQKPEGEQITGPSSLMLQRWQQETMIDQPYHNLWAVKKQANSRNTDQISAHENHTYSLGYIDR